MFYPQRTRPNAHVQSMNDSGMELIPYVPYPLGVDGRWDSPICLYRYLLDNDEERQRIQVLVNQQAWGGMIGGMIWIHHRCGGSIYLHYQQSDEDFQLLLLGLIYQRPGHRHMDVYRVLE